MPIPFGLRFDFRNPPQAGTSTADQYAAALDMAEWADRLGCASIMVSEHHGSADDYLPSPVVMLAAMAARTRSVRFSIAALVAPFYEPLRLAEDLVVLDNLSRGRLDLVIAGGYVPEEFEMLGVPTGERVRRVIDVVTALRGAFSGAPFAYQGRTVHITPGPARPNRLSITMGGSTEPAARRAARLADAFLPTDPAVWAHYRDELALLDRPDPGPCPIGTAPALVALAEDPEQGWQQMAPSFLHHVNSYGAWQAGSGVSTPYRTVADTGELRASGQFRVITPAQCVAELRGAATPAMTFHPLCGGMEIDLAWSSLRLFETEVLPAFADGNHER